MNELKPETRALLSLAREGDEPSAQAIEKNRRSLALKLAGASGAAGSALGLSSKAAAASGYSWGTTKVLLVCGVLMAGTGSMLALNGQAPHPASPPAPSVEKPASDLAITPGNGDSNQEVEEHQQPSVPLRKQDRIPKAPIARGEKEAGQSSATKTRSTLPRGEPTNAKSLQEEFDLIRSAQNHLHRGEPGPALLLLEQHEKRFPHGALADERRASFVMALCQAGNVKEARRRAKQFVLRSPSSPFVQRVQRACPTD